MQFDYSQSSLLTDYTKWDQAKAKKIVRIDRNFKVTLEILKYVTYFFKFQIF